MKTYNNASARNGITVDFTIPIHSLTREQMALLLRTLLNLAQPGYQHSDVIMQALTIAEEVTALKTAEREQKRRETLASLGFSSAQFAIVQGFEGFEIGLLPQTRLEDVGSPLRRNLDS